MRGNIPAKRMRRATTALTQLPKVSPKPAKMRNRPV
jgi:hypothetical protein